MTENDPSIEEPTQAPAASAPRVAIIGGGIVGVTTALRLAELGAYPIVLDAGPDIAGGTSAQNAGQLSFSSVDAVASPGLLKLMPKIFAGMSDSAKLNPLWIADYFSWAMQFLAQMGASKFEQNSLKNLELSVLSKSVFAEWRDTYAFEFDYRASGKITLFPDKAAKAAAETRIEAKRRMGFELEILSHEGVVRQEPTFIQFRGTCAGGLYSPGDTVGDAHKFAKAAMAHMQSQNMGEFLPNHKVLDWIIDNGNMRYVLTDHGRVEADAFVFAAGLNTAELCARLGKNLPIAPMAGYSLSLPLGTAMPECAITDTAAKAVVCQLGDRIRYAGFSDFVPSNTRLSQKRIETLKSQLMTRFPLVAKDQGDLSPWMGFRPLTPNSQPIVGHLAHKNIFVNAGHGMLGWILSAGSADRLARQIMGTLGR